MKSVFSGITFIMYLTMNRFYNNVFQLLCLLLCAHTSLRAQDPQSFIWTTDCADRNVCLNVNNCSVGNALIWQEAWSSCGNSVGINYSYRIDYNGDGSMDVISAADTLAMALPKGTHRVFWRAADQCGRAITCSHNIVVQDCQGPNMICSSGFTIGLNEPDCLEKFSAKRFLISYSDNCSATDKIQLRVRKVGAGTGFPTTDSVAFARCDIGVNLLEIWARDENGRTNQCNTFILLQQNNGICPCIIDGDVGLKGCTKTANNKKLSDYKIGGTIVNAPGGQPTLNKPFGVTVASDSCFTVTVPKVPLGGPYRATIRAAKSGQPLDGVTTLDLALINKHILGLDTFKTFYQVLAADVNGSKTVTTFDVVETRKLILGIYDTFPGVPAWLMIRPVANPAILNAFNAVRDTYQVYIPEVTDDINFSKLDYIGIKVGDVNYTAPLSFDQSDADDRATWPLLAEDRHFEAGENIRVPLRWGEKGRLDAWQLALSVDPDYLQWTSVEGLPAENYNIQESTLRALWYEGPSEDAPAPVLQLRALKAGRLSQALRLAPETLAAEAYIGGEKGSPARHALQLQFAQTAGAGETLWAAAPQPNPFTTALSFNFHLHQQTPVRLSLTDATGRMLFDQVQPFGEGTQVWTVEPAALPSGWVFYRLQAGQVVFSGKVLRQGF